MPHNLYSLPETAGCFNRSCGVSENEQPAEETSPAG